MLILTNFLTHGARLHALRARKSSYINYLAQSLYGVFPSLLGQLPSVTYQRRTRRKRVHKNGMRMRALPFENVGLSGAQDVVNSRQLLIIEKTLVDICEIVCRSTFVDFEKPSEFTFILSPVKIDFCSFNLIIRLLIPTKYVSR